jgi:O-antigen/teichoic acid export membrane protein
MWTVLWATKRSFEVALAVTVFGIASILTWTNSTFGSVLQAISRVGPAAVANVATKLIWGAGLLIAIRFSVPLAVLALPALVGELLRLAILVAATRREAHLELRVDVSAVRSALRESFPFFVNSLALGVLSSLGMSTLEFIRVDEREVGWFAAAQNVAYLSMLLSPMLWWVAMPLLSRAHARSMDEFMGIVRRCIEALVVTIMPITVLISAGSDVLIHFAFGDKYAPAATALSILSLVFAMTYTNMVCAAALIIMRRGWSVTTISIGAVFVTASLMFIFVPLGRHLIGTGGEAAGASAAVIGSEACVLIAMLRRFEKSPLDARNVRILLKSLALGVFILVVDRRLRSVGAIRLVVDAALYSGMALLVGVVRIGDAVRVVSLLRHRGAETSVQSP